MTDRAAFVQRAVALRTLNIEVDPAERQLGVGKTNLTDQSRQEPWVGSVYTHMLNLFGTHIWVEHWVERMVNKVQDGPLAGTHWDQAKVSNTTWLNGGDTEAISEGAVRHADFDHGMSPLLRLG